MSDTETKTTEDTNSTAYRARQLTTGLSRLTTLLTNQRVVVSSKNWLKSTTVIVNGVLFVLAVVVQLMDIIFNANIIEPIVKVFTTDPAVATQVLTVATQIYTAINIILRFKTTAPVTLNKETK